MTRHVPTSPAGTGGAPTTAERLRHDPVFQAFWLLRIGFTVAPILFGADKFAHVLTDWDKYFAPQLDRVVPGTAHQAMYVVGAVEIVAGLVVLALPRFGAYLVAAWLGGIIVDLLLAGGYYDIALRDFALFLAALTLARLATAFPHAAGVSEAGRRRGADTKSPAEVTR